MEQFYIQNSWDGGISDSDLLGPKGSVSEGVGVDINSVPGVLKVSQALVKEKATVDFVRFSINCTDGNSYYFGDIGTIYKRTSVGVWSTVHTDTQGAIIGAKEYDGYIYYASAVKLGRQSVVNAASESPWTSQNDSWATLNTATWHPMEVNGLYLFIGNDTRIASVDDGGTFTANGTIDVVLGDLPFNYEITTLSNFGIDILAGTKVTDTYSSAILFRWDTVSPQYNSFDEIPEIGINCVIPVDNILFIQAGTQGNIYYYNGSVLEKAKKIKGDYENKTMTCLPGSNCTFRGIPMFGVSNLLSNPCNQGVYSFGQYDRNYPLSLMLEYVISQNKITSISIGALTAIGNNLLVGWKDGANYGVDNISWSAKYASAYIKTISLVGERITPKTFAEYCISYKQKPTNTNITLTYDKNFAGTYAGTIDLVDESDYNKMRGLNNFEAGVAQFKIAFTISGNNAPEVEELYIKWNSQATI